MDEVELAGPLEDGRDVEAFRHLGLDVRILRAAASDDRGEAAEVIESAVAKSVTSMPRATSPSVSSEANCSHGP